MFVPGAADTADTDVSRGLPGISGADVAGAEIVSVRDAGTVGEGTANRRGNSKITTRTSTNPRIKINGLRVMFIVTPTGISVTLG